MLLKERWLVRIAMSRLLSFSRTRFCSNSSFRTCTFVSQESRISCSSDHVDLTVNYQTTMRLYGYGGITAALTAVLRRCFMVSGVRH